MTGKNRKKQLNDKFIRKVFLEINKLDVEN